MAGYDDDANWNRCWIEWNEKRIKCNRDVTSGHRSRRVTIGLMVVVTVATAVSTTFVVLIGGWVKHGGHLAEVGNDQTGIKINGNDCQAL